MFYADFKETKLSRLGFGMMRLPTLPSGEIDEALAEKMIDEALANGINYFDTAYPYHEGKSELIAGKYLSRHPRDSYYLASKYPGHQYADSYNPAEIFEDQLKKCRVDYFDFYLLHNVCESCIDVYMDEKWGILDYFLEQQRKGRIRHLGFSSHAEYHTLKKFLDYCGDQMEFCQIQLNYLDWTMQHAKERYALLCERNIPVWVMEPVRGGRLVRLPEGDQSRLRALRPDESMASWAFRWLMQHDNVKVILSGMSNMEQLADNLRTFSGGAPISAEESALLLDIASGLQAMIPCTGCRYCCDKCSRGLDIPMLLNTLNEARFAPTISVGMRLEALAEDKLPGSCIGCGACTRICPQHIEIPKLLKELAGMADKIPSWKKICIERAEAAKRLKS